ncbi:MAG: hypothetical protein ACRC0I_12475 [Sediminibacterium sp.]|jgi:hypothetical protein|nr:hypothetical protein [Chitinophagaceae bacterium]MCA6446583.1 hypothetical protein [Chitinophagaceae bacterium]TMN46211.1 hypothetical protein CWB91_23650 [Pseudoalteromonas piscicida]
MAATGNNAKAMRNKNSAADILNNSDPGKEMKKIINIMVNNNTPALFKCAFKTKVACFSSGVNEPVTTG